MAFIYEISGEEKFGWIENKLTQIILNFAYKSVFILHEILFADTKDMISSVFCAFHFLFLSLGGRKSRT